MLTLRMLRVGRVGWVRYKADERDCRGGDIYGELLRSSGVMECSGARAID